MKWKGERDAFKDGELRTIDRFAWLPVKLSDYSWLWLETYKEDQEFYIPFLHGFHISEFTMPRWKSIKKYQSVTSPINGRHQRKATL